MTSRLTNYSVAIFDPYDDTESNPSVMCLLNGLSESGASVDVFHTGAKRGWCNAVTFFPFPHRWSWWAGSLRLTLRGWKRFFRGNAPAAHWRLRSRRHDVVIAIDKDGAVAADTYAVKRGLPCVYVSFEILLPSEVDSPDLMEEKRIEQAVFSKASLVVVTDHWRLRLLEEANGTVHKKILFLPIAPGGKASSCDRRAEIRRRFGVPSDKILLVHTGTFRDWTYAEELVRSVSTWPQDIFLYVQTKDNASLPEDRFARELAALDLPNVRVSTTPLQPLDLEDLLGAADIGLLLYKSDAVRGKYRRNIQVMGLSSGKCARYLKMGLPIVSVNSDTYSELIQEHGFGLNVECVEGIPDAARQIMATQDLYRNRALRFYEGYLDFDLHWPKIEKCLADLCSAPQEDGSFSLAL